MTLLQALRNDGLSLRPVVPRLRIAHIAMDAHQGQIDRSLYPAQHPFDVVLIGILVLRTEETACVIRPPGDACCLHAEACHNLTTESLPVVADIT